MEKASTLFGGLTAAGLLMGSAASVGRVMGALWALVGAGLSAWEGFSGESKGEEVDEEKEETSLDCWLLPKWGEHLCCRMVLAESSRGFDSDWTQQMQNRVAGKPLTNSVQHLQQK